MQSSLSYLTVLSYLNVPEQFGVTLLLLALVLLLSPYLAGTDFGVIKIPEFKPTAKRALRVIGPVAMLAALLLHFPLVPKEETGKAVACSNLGPHEKRSYQSKLPKLVGLRFVSKRECG
jgi:hypothetical protein